MPEQKPRVGTKSKKTPLGLTPQRLWKELIRRQRLDEIKEALKRYVDADAAIPFEWVIEYNKIIEKEEIC